SPAARARPVVPARALSRHAVAPAAFLPGVTADGRSGFVRVRLRVFAAVVFARTQVGLVFPAALVQPSGGLWDEAPVFPLPLPAALVKGQAFEQLLQGRPPFLQPAPHVERRALACLVRV